MSERHTGDLDEQLCCLMDNELEDSQARFLFSRLANDAALRQRWERMHLARSVLQDRQYTRVDGLRHRVTAAIDNVTPDAAPVSQRARRWLQPLAGAAVAASVAVVAFNFWQSPAVDVGSTEAIALVDRPVADLNGAVNVGASQIAVPAVASAERQASSATLQQYMIRHAQATGGSGSALQHIYVVIEPVSDPVSESENGQATDGDGQTTR